MTVGIALLVIAAIIGTVAAPIAFVLLWHNFQATWLNELPRYQSLLGALIALSTASLASIGVGLTIWNQRLIVNRQLAAQRQEQDRALGLSRQQIASAFIGEITVILDELQHELLRPVLETALRDMQSSGGNERQVATARIGKHLGRFFSSSPGNVGIFPGAISERLTRFYTILEEIKLDLDWYSNAIETYTKERTHVMTDPQMLGLLGRILLEIDSCQGSGPILIEKLKEIRDAKLD